MNVLVVDDDPILLELARDALEVSEEMKVTLAEGAVEAFGLIGGESPPFDVILLDIMMPEIDGIEACRRFRTMPGVEDTVIIMMTALSDREHIDAAFLAGADDYVTKPVNPTDLASRIRLNLSRRSKPQTSNATEALTEEQISVDGLVGQGTLENYILALDRARASLSVATAFSVEIETNDVPEPDLLHAAGRCIVEEVSKTSCLVAYFGRGTFVCISRQGDPLMSRAVLKRIDTALKGEGGDSVKVRRRVLSDHKCGREMIAGIKSAVEDTAMGGAPRVPSRTITPLPDIFA